LLLSQIDFGFLTIKDFFIMKSRRFLTQKELLQKTGIKFYKLEYLIKTGIVPVIQKGRGTPRQFPIDAISIIRKIVRER